MSPQEIPIMEFSAFGLLAWVVKALVDRVERTVERNTQAIQQLVTTVAGLSARLMGGDGKNG